MTNIVASLTPDEIAHCKFIAEIEAGVLTPYFVDVPDGYYIKRLEYTTIPEGEFRLEWTANGLITIGTRYEDCRIPRYKKELRYKRG